MWNTKIIFIVILNINNSFSGRQDLNPQPQGPKPSALPVELLPLNILCHRGSRTPISRLKANAFPFMLHGVESLSDEGFEPSPLGHEPKCNHYNNPHALQILLLYYINIK